MKAFIAVCFVACIAATQAAGLTEEQIAKLKANKKTCVESSGADDALITKIRSGEHLDDTKAFNFVNCMFKLSSLINDEGVIQVDVLKQKAPTDITSEAIDKLVVACEHIKTLPKEKKAYEAYVCFKKQTQGKIELIPQAA